MLLLRRRRGLDGPGRAEGGQRRRRGGRPSSSVVVGRVVTGELRAGEAAEAGPQPAGGEEAAGAAQQVAGAGGRLHRARRWRKTQQQQRQRGGQRHIGRGQEEGGGGPESSGSLRLPTRPIRPWPSAAHEGGARNGSGGGREEEAQPPPPSRISCCCGGSAPIKMAGGREGCQPCREEAGRQKPAKGNAGLSLPGDSARGKRPPYSRRPERLLLLSPAAGSARGRPPGAEPGMPGSGRSAGPAAPLVGGRGGRLGSGLLCTNLLGRLRGVSGAATKPCPG